MFPIIFIDTETTGLDPAKAAVIEIAMIRREADGSESSFHSLIRPTKEELSDADPKALEINGFASNPSRWDEAPTMAKVGPEIADFARGAKSICGHNVSFDEGMIKSSFARHGVKRRLPYHKVDTVTLAFEHLTPLGLERVSMDSVRGFLRWSVEGAHTAMKDTQDAKRLFDLLWRMNPWRWIVLRLRLWLGWAV